MPDSDRRENEETASGTDTQIAPDENSGSVKELEFPQNKEDSNSEGTEKLKEKIIDSVEVKEKA